MRFGALGLVAGIVCVAGAAAAEDPEETGGVATDPPPAPAGAVVDESQWAATPVAWEQQSVRVGDTIMAPAVERGGEGASGFGEAKKRWYGGPILIVDGAAYVCLLLAASRHGELAPLAVPGLGGYALSGPVTHLAHGNWGRAGLSLLARGALPLTGAMLGASECEAESGDCISGVVSLAIVGMLAATALDAAVLAREPVPQERALVVEPLLGGGAGHAFIGARGAF